MIEEHAIVVAYKHDSIIFETLKKTACGSCSVNKTCGTGIISNYIKPKATQFEVVNTLGRLEIGDTVVIGINERDFLLGSFLMYLLPLFFLIIFALISEYFAVFFNIENTELLIITASGIGFFSSFIIIRSLLQHKLKLIKIKPELIRKIKI